MKHNRLLLLSFILLSFLLLTVWAAGFTQSLYANNATTGTITIVKEANPADGTDFAFTTNALPVTPTFALTWGSNGSGNGQFSNPYGVTVGAAGNVYVADTNTNRIQKFDSSGNFLLAWGSFGTSNGQFISPAGVAVDAAGNVYVADTSNHRIQKFDGSGNFLLKWGSSGSGNSQFSFPNGLAVGTAGNVYVADSNNNRIQKFDGSGNFLLAWGSFGTSNGQFISPYGVAVGAADNVYVADTDNSRIQKFDGSGDFLLAWGSFGTSNGQFRSARGVTMDTVDNVYVADTDNSRIQKFDSSGTFLLAWGSHGADNGQFFYPVDVVVNPAGNVYVAEIGNDRIQKFTTNSFALDDAVPDDGDAITNIQTFTSLLPASYTFTETVTGGWSLDNITCDGGNWTTNGSSVTVNLADGQHITCTFINNAQPGQISIVKEASPADGTDFLFTTNFTLPPAFSLAWGNAGSGNGQFNTPRGVATDTAGNVYVSDGNNHRIQKFDSSGNFLLAWGSHGSGNGQFIYPRGVAVDSAGTVYVADHQNHRIQKFDSSGNFLLAWGSQGSGNGQFAWPDGLAVDAAGNVYVADSDNDRIQKFNSSGNFLLAWGSEGSGNGQFVYTRDVVVDAANNVYVADHGNHRIQKFDSSGNFILAWGSGGSGNDQFNQPNGLAVDPAGNVYVADHNNHRIQKFDSSGNFLLTWGSSGSLNGQFIYPSDVAVAATGHIYVADTSNHRIQKFSTNSFTLDDAVPDDGDAITNTQTFAGLLPASYTFTETVTADWVLDSITCDGGSWTTTGNSVTVNLADSQHITCTFSNSLPPDLQLTKADGGITVEPDDVLTYTLTYINNGGQSSGVMLTDTVPLHTTFNPAASTPGWNCLPDNNPGSICTLTVGSVAFGNGSSVHFVVDVDNPLVLGVTQLENTAVIGDDGSNGPDQNPADNTATDTTPVNSFYGSNLSRNEALTGTPGTAVTYTLSITNSGNNNDFFDLSFSGNSWPVTLSQTTIGLAAGTSATFQVVVDIPAGAGDGEIDVVTITATSQGDGSQSDTADLTTTAEVGPESYQIFMPVVIRHANTPARPE